ncbi:MAG: DUF3147 family protein [Candidatus Jettenia sp.]|nr:DUF3147 family protein [Candidatus Jettenia sp.]
MQLKIFILYFILGGTIVSIATFIGSQGRGLLASFMAIFPAITLLTSVLIYNRGGQAATIHYAKGLLLMTPSWIIYVLCIIFLLPRLGFVKSVAIGVIIYMVFSWITSIIVSHFGWGA